MHERIPLSAPSAREARATAPAPLAPAQPVQRMLELQQSAGNALARRMAGELGAGPPRTLARCGGGHCGCGGACGGQAEELEELQGAAALRRAVSARG